MNSEQIFSTYPIVSLGADKRIHWHSNFDWLRTKLVPGQYSGRDRTPVGPAFLKRPLHSQACAEDNIGNRLICLLFNSNTVKDKYL